MSHVETDLATVVAGDVERLQDLKRYSPRDLSLAARNGGDALTLTSATLADVVEGLRARRLEESAVDEMSDIVDGVLSDSELEEMLVVLRRHVDRRSRTPGSKRWSSA